MLIYIKSGDIEFDLQPDRLDTAKDRLFVNITCLNRIYRELFYLTNFFRDGSTGLIRFLVTQSNRYYLRVSLVALNLRMNTLQLGNLIMPIFYYRCPLITKTIEDGTPKLEGIAMKLIH